MRKTFLLLLIAFTLPCSHAHAQEFNAGFVQGLWYSQEKIFAEDTVRIYVAIRNNSGSDLTGTVEFFDNGKKIGRKSVQALDGRIIESWADWTPDYGDHTLEASLSRIELHAIGSSTKEVEVTSALAKESLFVDHDTDDDGTGNEEDTDDDGDSIRDTDDAQPLIPAVPSTAAQADEDEVDEEADTHTDDQDNTADKARNQEGLERYLSESPAENVLSSVTTYIHSARERLDDYRQERTEKHELQSSSTPVNSSIDGFGEVTRSTSTSASFNFGDILSSVFKLIGTLVHAVYTWVLAALSFVLSHPILVQLGFLLLILFLLVKGASKLGGRPKGYK